MVLSGKINSNKISFGEDLMGKQIIHFNHKLLGSEPLLFQNPIETVVANSLSEVKQAINTIESYAKLGFYAVGYVSYEAGKAFQPQMKIHRNPKMPYISFGIYERREIYEIKENQSSVDLDFHPD